MFKMSASSRKRPCTSAASDDEPCEPEGHIKVGSSIKFALGDLYQETVQLRSDVKELKDDVHSVLKNQDKLSQSLKHIAKMLSSSNSKGQRSDDVKNGQQHQDEEKSSDCSEDNGLDNEDKEDCELDDYFGHPLDRGCQTDPVTIFPHDFTKSNKELQSDIKAVLQNQTTLSFNMKSIYDMLNRKGRSSVITAGESHPVFIEPDIPPDVAMDSSPASKDQSDVDEITEVRPTSVDTHYDNSEAGPSHPTIDVKTPSPVPIPQSLLASGILKPVPKVIPGPYTGTFLVGGDSTLVRDIAEYESILMQIYTKKPLESDTEKARGLLRHLFRMVIPAEILATCKVTGKSRDAVTHRWIRVPKIDEALLLPIFNQARFQFPEFTDWYTDEKSRTVQYLNNVCKTVRHSSSSRNSSLTLTS